MPMTMSTPAAPAQARALDARLMTLLAMTMFTAAGSIHFQTSMLGAIAQELGADTGAVGWVPTMTFAGFVSGIVFIVPLGDRADKRRLILTQHVALVASLLAMALAPSLAVLAGLSFVMATVSCFSQNILPFVTELARPNERGRAVATILTALFLGILFARVVGGAVASTLGWRWMYVISAAMLAALGPALARRLPAAPPKTTLPYRSLIGSLAHLVRSNDGLRRASATQFLIGICYGGFWATLAPMLISLHGLGPAQIGLMAIPGSAGIFAARPAGRWMDRRGVVPVVTTGVGLVLGAFVVFGFAALWIGAVVIGAVLLDCGLRSAMVANQTLINSQVPDARSRFNTIFAAHVWGGNATGALLGSVALAHAGWLAVCAIGMVSAACALVLQRRAPGGALKRDP
jgi:predicted MFS family arabinose efflux permease